MKNSGSTEVGADDEVVRIFCAAVNDFHAKKGKTWLATFAHSTEGWLEVTPKSRKVAQRQKAWLDSLTPEEEDAVVAGELRSPYGNPQAGRREPALTYLRGDEVAPDHEQRRIEWALRAGTNAGALGGPAKPEDIAGRAKFDRRCPCGEPPVRVRAEDLWPVLEAFKDAGHHDIELAMLRSAVQRAKARKSR